MIPIEHWNQPFNFEKKISPDGAGDREEFLTFYFHVKLPSLT